MKIMQILPEFEEGGVERHVLWLSNELVSRGHEVTVVSAGGKLENQLDPGVRHHKLPVHLKNPATAAWCALKIARFARQDKYDLLHAHSRVPAWISYWCSSIVKVPYVVTVHTCFGNRSRWLYLPYRKAKANISVSSSVKDSMGSIVSSNNLVIKNGIKAPPDTWNKRRHDIVRFLFIGRLSPVKGIQDIFSAFSRIKTEKWRLDVLGDGPLMESLKTDAQNEPLKGRVFLHGFCENTEKWLKECDCFLFPSYYEGMPLTLAEVVLMRVPFIVSDIPEVKELTSGEGVHLPPGDVDSWADAIGRVVGGTMELKIPSASSVPTIEEMVDKTLEVYASVLT